MRIIIEHVRFYGLLVHYLQLQVLYICLLIRYCLLKVAGAALVEAVKIEYCIKSFSKENLIIFAACIAVSIYGLALFVFIRI